MESGTPRPKASLSWNCKLKSNEASWQKKAKNWKGKSMFKVFAAEVARGVSSDPSTQVTGQD